MSGHGAQRREEIPDAVLDAALQWAVRLHSGTACDADRKSFAAWLDADPLHQSAWRRVQAVEDEFTRARHTDPAHETLDRVARRRDRKRRYKIFGGVLSLLVAVGLVLGPGDLYDGRADYTTGTGERQRVALADGGELYLNAGTALDIERRADGTLVHLYRGEIYIDSADALPGAKPRVDSGDGRLVPVGTRFVVDKSDDGTDLAVTGGAVAVLAPAGGDAGEPLAVGRAGQAWRLRDGRVSPLSPSGLRPDAWVEGIVEADNAPLARVLDALDRHRHGWLRYDVAAAKLRVTGVFRLDDTDSALRALERTLPIRVERFTGWWVTVEGH